MMFTEQTNRRYKTMMKSEFESLAGRAVTDEQYKAIETLYMSSNLYAVAVGLFTGGFYIFCWHF